MARPGAGGSFAEPGMESKEGALALVPRRLRPAARRVRPWLRPEPTYRSPALRGGLAERFASSFQIGATVVDIGCGGKRLPGAITLDIAPGPNVDVVGSAEALPFADESVDGVVLQAVLEHVRDGRATLDELARVLKTGGRAHVEIPFMQAYHASPGDYRRYTVEGLEEELRSRGLTVVRSGVVVGPGSAASAITAEYLALLLSGRSATLFRIMRLLTAWLALPLKWTDRWLDTHPMAYVVASGVYCEARK